MKASEQITGFNSKLREYTNYALRSIKKVCKDIGPRPGGYESEKKAQEFVAEDLKKYADSVDIEPFDVHPKAFMGWFVICGILGIIGITALNFGFAVITLCCFTIAAILILGEFLFYKKVIDFLFPKKTSHNVYATRKASGETKRHIILSGHIDSAYEWRYTFFGGKALLFSGLISAIVGMLFIIVITVIGISQGLLFEAPDGLLLVLYRVSIIFIIPFFGLIVFVNFKRPVEGANDNLTGVFVSAAVLKFLSDNNVRFENTDVSVLSTGCEEEGLRGADAFGRKHKAEFTGDVETVVLVSDTLKDYDCMAIYTKDMSGTVRNSMQASALFKKAGETAGVELEYSLLYAGSSDAAAFSKLGITSSTFASMDPGPPRYYHTRLDTAEIMEPKTIEKSIEILLEAVYLFDEQGLKDKY